MNQFLALTACLVMIVSAGSSFAAKPGAATRDTDDLRYVIDGPGTVIHSATSSTTLLLKQDAGPDTFALFGGVGTTEGKFNDVTGTIPERQGWIGVDKTDRPVYWHLSDFNMANLNGNGPGNMGMWCGVEADSPLAAGFGTAPGYGNGWNDFLLFEGPPLATPAVGMDVHLDFVFHCEMEPGEDYLGVDYDMAGTWTNLYRSPASSCFVSGSAAPGRVYSAEATSNGGLIHYNGGDFGGDNGDQVRIRLTGFSDTGWSDEDGLWPTQAGLAQVDDITINWTGFSSTTDFEGPGPFDWTPVKPPFAGDFSDVFSSFTDIDPCASNSTPMMGFIDHGQAPPNGPGVDGTVSTGGSFSMNWNYGISSQNVFNYTGGLTHGLQGVDNEVWSPEIDWDHPLAGDDGPDFAGSSLTFTTWRHNQLLNGIFYSWRVRAFKDGEWTDWANDGFVYFSRIGEYLSSTFGTTEKFPQSPEKVQIALRGVDLADAFGFPGADATPAPLFDNVRLIKYRIGGIAMSTRTIDLANDGFPVNGLIDASTPTLRADLDVPFDMALDIGGNATTMNIPGDSVVFWASAIIPGTSIADLRMKWALLKNPLFEAAIRNLPSRAKDVNVVAGANIWTGEVIADTSLTSAGAIVDDRFFVDVPDTNFMFPGDILHYYIEATDSDGRVTTLPDDTTGFGIWDANKQSDFTRTWTVRALPSLTASGQPTKLIYNDFGRRDGEFAFTTAMSQLGLFEGVDWDSYTTQGPTSGVSNGIGSAAVDTPLGRRGHGATPTQLAGYDTIMYLSGNLTLQLMSAGTDNDDNDKSPDLAVLTAWKSLAGPRNTVYFGDAVASATEASSSEGLAYIALVMGVGVTDTNVRDEIDNQTAPVVGPLHASFATELIAYGGCSGINEFDSITPVGSAVRGHGFVGLNGVVYPSIAASVVYDRLEAGDRKVDITFPYGDLYVYDNVKKASPGVSTRALLFEEIFEFFGVDAGAPGDAVSAPPLRQASLSLFPNPFNPKATVEFSLPRAGVEASVRVFNVRGELVRTLHDGMASDAKLTLEWNGTDNRNAKVASGVYLVRAITEGFSATKKTVLVK